MASSLEQRLGDVSEEYGLKLNVTKTKWMLVSKNRTPIENLVLNQTSIEHVNKYLETNVHNHWSVA